MIINFFTFEMNLLHQHLDFWITFLEGLSALIVGGYNGDEVFNATEIIPNNKNCPIKNFPEALIGISIIHAKNDILACGGGKPGQKSSQKCMIF